MRQTAERFLRLGHPTILLPLLSDGQIDFAFADIFSKRGDFSRELSIYSVEPLINEELILVSSAIYYDRELNKDISFHNLSRADYISYQRNYAALKSWFRHHFNKTSIRLNIVLTVENVEGVMRSLDGEVTFRNVSFGYNGTSILKDISFDAHAGETIAIVSHGLALAIIQVEANGLPIETVWDHIPSNANPQFLNVERL